jgi:hypothetical protein
VVGAWWRRRYGGEGGGEDVFGFFSFVAEKRDLASGAVDGLGDTKTISKHSAAFYLQQLKPPRCPVLEVE